MIVILEFLGGVVGLIFFGGLALILDLIARQHMARTDAASAPVEPVAVRPPNPAVLDALDALVKLGWSKREAREAVGAAVADLPAEADVSEIVRAAFGAAGGASVEHST